MTYSGDEFLLGILLPSFAVEVQDAEGESIFDQAVTRGASRVGGAGEEIYVIIS
jgi:hypothetical protein